MKADELQINIVTSKFVEDDIKRRRIVTVTHNIPETGIPHEYQNSIPRLTKFTADKKTPGLVMMYRDEGQTMVNGARIVPGDVFTETEWQTLLPFLTQAKESLIASFKQREILEHEWTGEETFDI